MGLDTAERQKIIALMHREVVLATGCTEPVAVALAAAKTRETLGAQPDKVRLYLSKNVFKNAMGVGIPGTGMIGLPVAVAMGVTKGQSQRKLEVLDMSADDIHASKQWLEQHRDDIEISVKDNCDKLYIECVCTKGNDTATAIIAGQHTCFVHVSKNGNVLYEQKTAVCCDSDDDCGVELTARKVYDFATTAPLDEISFINDTVKYNMAASDRGLAGEYGLTTGKLLMNMANGDVVHTTVAKTVAASDARMDGCTVPVFSNSGSGNQGIACTIPVYEYGKLKNYSDETITRGLIMSHLMSIYVKHGIGRLSALCGVVNASIGVTSALTYMQGGDYRQITFAIKNMINTLTGMLCDGAKPSCALKVATGIYSAFVTAELALHTKVVDETDGLSEADTDRSIQNVCKIGKDGMNETDDMILEIMTHKKFCSNS